MCVYEVPDLIVRAGGAGTCGLGRGSDQAGQLEGRRRQRSSDARSSTADEDTDDSGTRKTGTPARAFGQDRRRGVCTQQETFKLPVQVFDAP